MNAVGESREMFARCDPSWSRPLFVALDTHQPGLGYYWLEQCVRLLLPRTRSDAREKLEAEIHQIRRLREAGARWEDVATQVRAVWYMPPARDPARAAVAKLYEAAFVEVDVRSPKYARAMAAPLNNLLCGASESLEMLDIVVLNFIKTADECGLKFTESTRAPESVVELDSIGTHDRRPSDA